MSVSAPKLYKKNADQVIHEIEEDLKNQNVGWEGRVNGPGWALVRLFNRLSELTANRLNAVPDKHFFSFLNTAGIDFVPPSAASTELTFTMAKDGPPCVVIPKGSQMATVETENVPEIVFETDRDMVLSPNSLACAFAFDNVCVTDVSQRATGAVAASYPAFEGDSERERKLYLADPSLFVFEDDTQREAASITISFTFDTPGDPSGDGWHLSWAAYDGDGWNVDLNLNVQDNTQGFSRNNTVVLSNLPPLSESELNGTTAVWICCEITGGTERSRLPVIRSITGRRAIHVPGKEMTADSLTSAIQSGTTYVPQDQENDFFPLGQRPARLDAFYIQLDEALNKDQSTISMSMTVDHAPDSVTRGIALSAVVEWEYYGKNGWGGIYDIAANAGEKPIDLITPGSVSASFVTPSDILPCKVNGTEGYWIRARLVSGKFEIDGYMSEKTVNGQAYPDWVSPVFCAPIISDLSLTLNYKGKASEPQAVTGVLGCVDASFSAMADDLAGGKSISPFKAREEGPAFYLGFAQAFPKGKWIQVRLDVDEDASHWDDDKPLDWEYYNGREFSPLRISDGTDSLTKKGYLGFFAPEDHAASTEFGVTAYYIRVIPETMAAFSGTPYMKTIRANTIPATNSVTDTDVGLGSSDGKANQGFTLKRTPVLFGVQLAVLEPDIPPDEELANHKKELDEADFGADVFPYSADTTSENQCWVRWIQVTDFFSSKPLSRHFTVDSVTGQILFGDGARGSIPPVGVNNIKVVAYKSHNGALGNVDKDSVVVIRNPAGDLTHIKTVTNHEASAGGSDVETLAEIRERGPQRLKHRERSVTWEDYEWLAREASSEIRTAKCFPVTDNLGRTVAGHVAVVITPESKAKKPTPGPALIRKVKSFLEKHALCNLGEANAQNAIHVTGPSYVACTVNAKVSAVNPESSDQVELDILTRLDAFLNPLTGGPGKSGWQLGRDVFLSEISAEIETVDGVDHVESVTLSGSLQQYTLTLAREDGAYRELPFEVGPDSRVSTFDERIAFLLADPLYPGEDGEACEIRTMTIYGFKADDTVSVVDEANVSIKDNLTLASVTGTQITFETPFDAPSDWDVRNALMSEDKRLRLPLAGTDNVILDDNGKVAGLNLTIFEPGDQVCVVAGTRRDPVLEFMPISSVDQAVTRIYVPETCLAYSGTHDIDMVL